MCPHLSNLNHNNGSGMNATNIVTDLSNISNMESYNCGCDEHCSYNNGVNQNGGSNNGDGVTENSPRRNNSMDRLMGLLNDMGRTQRTRSLSDGGQEEGKKSNKQLFQFGFYLFISLFQLQPKKNLNLTY